MLHNSKYTCKLFAGMEKVLYICSIITKGTNIKIIKMAKLNNKFGNTNNKEYTYFFKGGGWNTEFAPTKKQAYKQAVERWGNSKTLIPIYETFFIANEKQTSNLMGLFN